MKSIGEALINLKEKDGGKYLKHEWQLYGYRLALWLGDEERVSLYMRLAKKEKRETLQAAWDFVKDSKARSKAGLFLWKIGQIKGEEKSRSTKD